MIKSFFKPILLSKITWKSVFVLTFFSAYVYVFMEWLFTVTKPSFMSNMNFLGKLEILLFVGSLAALFSLIAVGLIFFLSRIPFIKKIEKRIFGIATLMPAAILSALILIMVDNFTYTVFRYGIISTNGIWRAVYAILFLILFVFIYRSCYKFQNKLESERIKINNAWMALLLIVVFLAGSILIPYFRHGGFAQILPAGTQKSSTTDLPNIIIITSDGVNAGHTSLYGYERDTTPFLRSLSPTSLIAENAFTNSANTSGSIVSILNGKYTTTTGVLYPPNILRANDAYQHLPGILKTLGYYSIQLGFEVYVDAYNVNLLSGFDEVNGRSFLGSNYFDKINSYLPGESAYFFYDTFNRIFDRLRHIFFLHTMENAFSQVTTVSDSFSDTQKLDKLLNILESKDQPIFAHIHWMGTHGAKFYLNQQVFSEGKQIQLQNDWDPDFYDDSILEVDQSIKRIYEKLQLEGKENNTIIVFASDHGQKYVTDKRVPLLFHFPNGEFAGVVSKNAQNIDIAPTLLNYIGQEIPDWMEGKSLLEGLDQQRPIFAAGAVKATVEDGFAVLDNTAVKPPFFQFGYFTVIDCNHWYRLDVIDGISYQKGKIGFYDTVCNTQPLKDIEALQIINSHLKDKNFDTTVLEAWIEAYQAP